ncbi:MAG: AAA family ATPase [Acidimicrobiia bacterium]|nr:AAA family ATPase [Acidimicrobiia bacterium]
MDTLRPREFDEIAALEQPSIVASMWRYRWLVALIVALFIGLGLAFQAYVPAAYRATAEMTVEDPRTSSLADALGLGAINSNPARYVADQVGILQASEVEAKASELVDEWRELAETDPEALNDNASIAWLAADPSQVVGMSIPLSEFHANTSISSDRESNRIEIGFSADTPERARVGANAIVEAYREVRTAELRETANTTLTRIREEQDALQTTLAQLRFDIEQIQLSDETRASLLQEFEDDLARFGQLQDRLDELDPDSEAADTVRQQLDDLLQDFQTFEVIDRIQQRDANLQALQVQQDQVINELADLNTQANSIIISVNLQGAGITSASAAALPLTTSGSGPARILAAAIVLGLAVSAAITYFLASRRRAFGSRTLPELVLNAPLLAEVPDFTLEGIKSSLPVTQAPTSASAEAFRFAAAAVDIRASAAGAKSLMMVSATLASGKTTAAANTAIAAAREGLRVLVIDADFGNQELTSLFLGEEQPAAGITEVVAGLVPLDQAVRQVVVTDDRSLYLLWRGRQPVEAANFFRTEDTQRFFTEVKDQFDLVIIDGPPLLQVAYASTLVRYVDAVVAIVAHNSRVGELEEVADRLHFIETPAIGYIYTKAPLRAEMTASEGSMKDILGLGGESAGRTPAGAGSRIRRARRNGEQ